MSIAAPTFITSAGCSSPNLPAAGVVPGTASVYGGAVEDDELIPSPVVV